MPTIRELPSGQFELTLYDAAGKRVRSYHDTKKGAEEANKKHEAAAKRAGNWWIHLKPAVQMEVQVVCEKAAAENMSLTQLWEEHQAMKKERDDPASAKITPMGYAMVVIEWGNRKLGVGKSQRYVMHAKDDLMRFGEGQEERHIHTFQMRELSVWIAKQRIKKKGADFGKPWGLSTKKTWISLFHGLWDCAVKCGWATKNITDAMEQVGRLPRVKRIYLNDQILKLLAACLYNAETKTYLGALIMGSHGCMRPEEITSDKARLNKLPKEKWFGWKDIDLDNAQAHVSTDIAKRGDERVISLQPMTVEWLRYAKKLGCEFPPVNRFKVRDLVYDIAGIPVPERIRDGLRHNCATHLRVIYKNDYDVVRDLGNSVRILLKDYADLKTPAPVSRDHWNMTIERVEEYMKTREWKEHVRRAFDVILAAKPKQEPSASETEASEG